MSRHQKLLDHILMQRGDANVPFTGLCQLLHHLGFTERVKGDHHIFARAGLKEILNLQPRGVQAKPYQVRQVRDLVLRYGLTLGD